MHRRYLLVFGLLVSALAAVPAVRLTAAPSRAVAAIDAINVKLAGRGSAYRVAKLDYITAPASGRIGATVFAKDVGNRQLDFRFVPDLLAYASQAPGVLSFAIDTKEGAANGGLTPAQTSGAIR